MCSERYSFRIFVKSLTGRTDTFEVNGSDTIDKIKAKYLDKTGMPLDYIKCLIFAGKALAGDDDECTLDSYRVLSEATLHVIEGGGGSTGHIFVKTPTGRFITVTAWKCSKVQSIKEDIDARNEEGGNDEHFRCFYPPNQQRLILAGKELLDHYTVGDHITSCEMTLHLVLDKDEELLLNGIFEISPSPRSVGSLAVQMVDMHVDLQTALTIRVNLPSLVAAGRFTMRKFGALEVDAQTCALFTQQRAGARSSREKLELERAAAIAAMVDPHPACSHPEEWAVRQRVASALKQLDKEERDRQEDERYWREDGRLTMSIFEVTGQEDHLVHSEQADWVDWKQYQEPAADSYIEKVFLPKGRWKPAAQYKCVLGSLQWYFRTRAPAESDTEQTWADQDFWQAVLRQSDWTLNKHASEELRADRSVVLAAVKQSGRALKHASEELKADRGIVLAAVQQKDPLNERGIALCYASKELRADRSIVLAAVQQSGGALEHASEELKADHSIVLTAVQQCGGTLKHASEELKADRAIVLAAWQRCGPPELKGCCAGKALRFASKELQQDICQCTSASWQIHGRCSGCYVPGR